VSLTGQLVLSIKNRIQELREDLSDLSATDLYVVGKLQGRIQGLKESLMLLENLIEETDKD